MLPKGPILRRFNTVVIAALLMLVFAGTGSTADDRDFVELVRIETSDGIRLDGALRRPPAAADNAGIVMIHGYSGNFYSGVMSFLPAKLSHLGFTTLAVNMRDHDRGPKRNRFEENLKDIAAAVDEMALRGGNPIFLLGHSMGTNRVLYYLAETRDPRISGIILTGPPGNLFQWNVSVFGRESASRVLEQARELVAGGNGDDWMLVDLGPLGKALYTANHLVSLRGPESVSDPFNNIARILTPVLILHGLEDRLANPETADRIQHSAAQGVSVTVIKMPGADHGFNTCREELAEAINRWLTRITRMQR